MIVEDFERYFFEIAVYSCNADRFFAERENKLNSHLDWITRQSGGTTREQAPHTFMVAEQYFLKTYGDWRYTQAIGWIRLYILGTQIRGESWIVDAKHITREMNKKKFYHYGKAFELDFFLGEDSSSEIFSQLCDTLANTVKDKPFKGRYLDLEAFQKIGPFINWREFIGLE